jgi:hypothetical protein
VEQGLLSLQERLSLFPIFSEVRVDLSLVFCVMFCRSLFVLLSFFFWPLCCLSYFDLRFLITPLLFSNLWWCNGQTAHLECGILCVRVQVGPNMKFVFVTSLLSAQQ